MGGASESTCPTNVGQNPSTLQYCQGTNPCAIYRMFCAAALCDLIERFRNAAHNFVDQLAITVHGRRKTERAMARFFRENSVLQKSVEQFRWVSSFFYFETHQESATAHFLY